MSLVQRFFSSADPSAPQVTGQVGTLLSTLRAILVSGYGSGPTLKAGLGWTEDFTGTNKAVFRGDAVSGTGYRVRVDDTIARYGLVRGFETMSDVDNGTGLVPTTLQYPSGVYLPKSTTADSTARAWWAIGNERHLYFFVDPTGIGLDKVSPHFFGDIASLRPGDAHHFFTDVNALTTYTGGNANMSNLFASLSWGSTPNASTAGGCIARSYAQSPGALLANNSMTESGATTWGGSAAAIVYPHVVNNGLLYSRGVVSEAPARPRGYMPGVYVPFHFQPYADLADIADVEGLPSGTHLIAKSFRTASTSNSGGDGQILFDITNAS